MTNTDPQHWFLPSGDIPRDPTYTSNNEAIALVDGEEYYSHLAARLKKMSPNKEFYLAGWRVTPGVFLEPLATPTPAKFLDQLTGLIKKGIVARTMVWYFPGTLLVRVNHPGENLDFTRGVIAAGGKIGTGILDERLISKLSSHHQKFVILEADGDVWSYVGGIDLCVDRWDTSAHNSPPQRQKEFLDGWHDVQCAVRGAAVTQVWHNFQQRWNDRNPPTRPPSPVSTTAASSPIWHLRD